MGCGSGVAAFSLVNAGVRPESRSVKRELPIQRR